jgi:hypothetical protein
MAYKIGDTVKASNITKGVPPIVLQLQPTGYIALKKPDELKQWEEDVKRFHGVSLSGSNVHACETCSGGCTDDCGML